MSHTRIEMVPAPDGSGEFALTVVAPEGGSGPGVLLLQEIFGVGEFLFAKAEDLAAAGYVVGCPDVFWRIEPGFAVAHDEAGMGAAFAAMGRYADEVDEPTKVADLVAAFDALGAAPEVGGRAVAVMGYCLGGRLAYELAMAADPVACVSYYGSGIHERLDGADAITCPVLFQYGGDDPFIPVEQIEAVTAAFDGQDHVTVVVEADAGHAFENLYAGAFANEEAAARSWPRTLEFLSAHLRP